MTVHRIRICKCGHEEAIHNGNGCHYGHDSIHGECDCDKFRSRKALGKRIESAPAPTTALGALKAAAEFLTLAIGLLEKQPELPAAKPKLFKRPVMPVYGIEGVGKTSFVDPPKKQGSGVRKILIAIAQHREGVTRKQIAILTGYKRSTRDAYLLRLRADGYIEDDGRTIQATANGVKFLGSDFKQLPTGASLREYWLGELPDGESEILQFVCNAYPGGVDREAISEQTGFARSTRDAYIQRLKARKLVVAPSSGEVVASKELF